jgi:hypothetical protein
MEKAARKSIGLCAAAAALCLAGAAHAQGGNGNGGSGGGGSHGPATSGMTYHCEPVTSPWGKDPGHMYDSTGMTQTDIQHASVEDGAMPAKTAQ